VVVSSTSTLDPPQQTRRAITSRCRGAPGAGLFALDKRFHDFTVWFLSVCVCQGRKMAHLDVILSRGLDLYLLDGVA